MLVHKTESAATVLLKQVAGAGDEQLIRTATSVKNVLPITLLVRIVTHSWLLLPLPLNRLLPPPNAIVLSR